MEAAELQRKLTSARLDDIGPGGGRWLWRYDAALIAAVLAGRHLPKVIKATHYSTRRCRARIRRLLPAVLHRDAKTALLAELRARALAEPDP